MSHGIELTDGRANMAYTGRTPWHSLGQNIEGTFDAETALREANLDWEVEVAPLYYETLENLDESGSKQYIKHVKSDKGQIVRRVDTGDELGGLGLNTHPSKTRMPSHSLMEFLVRAKPATKRLGIWVRASGCGCWPT